MQIKKENLLAAHKDGCSNVKKVLEALFPDTDFTPPKPKLKYNIGHIFYIPVIVDMADENDPNNTYYITQKRGLNVIPNEWCSEEELNSLFIYRKGVGHTN